MISFSDRWINIDASARCSLECPKCMRQSLRANGMDIPGDDMTVDQFEKIVKHFAGVSFCGQISDPIFSPHLIEFLKMCKQYRKGCEVRTAASQKSEQWYSQAFQANTEAKWVFGIDGLPHESFVYRVNQDGEKLFDMMLLAKTLGIRAIWQYIVFRYNEEHIDQAKLLARQHDIEFELHLSARWNRDNAYDWYRPTQSQHRIMAKDDRKF